MVRTKNTHHGEAPFDEEEGHEAQGPQVRDEAPPPQHEEEEMSGSLMLE